MTLEQLGQEYVKEADRLKARLCDLRILLKRSTNEEEKLNLKKRIYYLYAEMREVEQTAEYLMNYYSEGQSPQRLWRDDSHEKFIA